MLRQLGHKSGVLGALASAWPTYSTLLCHRAASTTVTRNACYSELNEDDVAFFRDTLGGRGVVEDETALEAMNRSGEVLLCTISAQAVFLLCI